MPHAISRRDIADGEAGIRRGEKLLADPFQMVSAREPRPETARRVDPVGSVAVVAGSDQRKTVVAFTLHQQGVARAEPIGLL